jgi:K+-transporting ATPase ATPase A chain
MLAFSLVSMLVLYALPAAVTPAAVNPQGLAKSAPDLAFNTAASFTTNTNWQSYVGETTMSYITQMAGPRVPQLRVGRGRHRAGHRVHPRHCVA